MQTIKLDPNFRALCDMVKENDIATMREDLIDGVVMGTGEKLSTEQTEELRYRLGVFKEFLDMPDTIITAMTAERTVNNAEEERSDPFFTQADIEKSRG